MQREWFRNACGWSRHTAAPFLKSRNDTLAFALDVCVCEDTFALDWTVLKIKFSF